MNKIPTICFDDIYDFCLEVENEFFGRYHSLKDNDVIDITVIAKYEKARKMMAFFAEDDFELANVEFHDPNCDGYEDEYIITLCYGLSDNEEKEIWCEPAKNENGYLITEGQAVYILDECNKDMIPKVLGDKTFIVELDNEDLDDEDDDEFSDDLEIGTYHCNEDCENCHEYDKDDKDDDYVTIKLDKFDVEMLHKLYNIFGI